ncbi:MAG: hypothetical protein H6669_00220 [Ardenticatenaceae bacterium]|nr:hypothetical protein [Ardenticatenaceae bacterium]
MIRKLTRESIEVDLANINRMIDSANELGDFVGAYQFSKRKEDLENELANLNASHVTNAGVALFFSGEPVLGSKGISTDFAGRALQHFQEIVTKSFATQTVGKLGERGKVPFDKEANLLVTGIAHGSFGFVLQEPTEQLEIFDTPLKEAVDFAVAAIVKSSSEDDDVFVELTEELNHRLLLALSHFFRELDNHNATVRLVDDHRDHKVDDTAIDRARLRIAGTTIEEEEEEPIEGTLIGFMPTQKRFEMILQDEIISGSTTEEAATQFNNLVAESATPIGYKCLVQMEVRTIKPFNRERRNVYRLLSIEKVLDSSVSTDNR